jgi:hypothetical protein
MFFKSLVRIWYGDFHNIAPHKAAVMSPRLALQAQLLSAQERGATACVSVFSWLQAADSSVALAFAVGRGYEATDAAKRLKFGASPTDGVERQESALLLSLS